MAERRLLWYPFYVGDYLIDTAHLTREQDYAYRKILDDIFWNGQKHDSPFIVDDDEYLRRLAKASPEEWPAIREALIDGPQALLLSLRGCITQKRMTSEIKKARRRSDINRQSAEARWQNERKRPSNRSGSKKSPEAVGDHGQNGHGQAMSRQQYLFFAGRIGKWIEQNRSRFVGDTNGAFEHAFEQEIGLKWKDWLHEKELQEASGE